MTPQTAVSNDAMDADLARSGLVASDMDAVADPPNEFALEAGSPSYHIPYYLPDGSVHPRMWRKRLHNPGAGMGKYTQPSKADIVAAGGQPWEATLPYMNPKVLALAGQSWASLATVKGKRVLLVEGEKKSLSAMKYIGRPAIGIPGAQTAYWRPPAPQTPDDPTKVAKAAAGGSKRPFELNPAIADVLNPGDHADVVFDADVLTNPDVNQAAGTLRRLLEKHGVSVSFVLLPVVPGAPKMGLDDWIAGVQDKALVPALFDALERTDGHGFAAHKQTVHASLDLDLSAKDVPLATLTNIRRILDGHPDLRDRLWYDCVSNRLYESFSGVTRLVTDSTPADLTKWMQQTLGLHHYTHSLVGTELYATADSPKHTRNRILDEIGATKWDGTARVEELFITAFGADDTTYTRMVGRYWTISAIARLIRAGCQVDTMLVLEGDQGIGKSKALEILGGVGYAALQQKLDNKDFLVTAHTAWIVDMVELGAMKYADMEQIKGLITTRTDSYRAPYGRASVDRPRRFIMVGTTNSDDYLRDDTGNRRFWPMKCNGEINYAWLTENRAQLWAEALHRYMANEQWWEDYNAPTVQATREMQQSRVPDDPWQDLLAAILTNRTAMRKVTYCGAQHYFMAGVELLHALNVGPNDMPKYSRRLRAAMRKMIEWREHHYASKTQSITLATGGTAMSIRGYIHVGSVPPSAGNVTQLPQPSKF